MRLYQSDYCNERIQMDVCRPVNMSHRVNRYLLVITDRFRKFTKAFAMPNKESKTIAELVVMRWLLEYGEPEQVHTDQGSEFDAKWMKQVWELYKVKKAAQHLIIPRVTRRWSVTIRRLQRCCVHCLIIKRIGI